MAGATSEKPSPSLVVVQDDAAYRPVWRRGVFAVPREMAVPWETLARDGLDAPAHRHLRAAVAAARAKFVEQLARLGYEPCGSDAVRVLRPDQRMACETFNLPISTYLGDAWGLEGPEPHVAYRLDTGREPEPAPPDVGPRPGPRALSILEQWERDEKARAALKADHILELVDYRLIGLFRHRYIPGTHSSIFPNGLPVALAATDYRQR